MKILTILTGGTIGSVIRDGYIYTDDNAKKIVINNYLKEYNNDVEFQIVEPFTVHSEYLSHREINTLVDIVCDSVTKDYDGIIVTHGTDSLQFTASALSFAVGNCNMPVLLVSAQYPMADFRSNGQINFNGAVDFIKNKKGAGVYVAYSNDNEKVGFHQGNRVIMFNEADDKVYSLPPVSVNSAIGKYQLKENSETLVITVSPGAVYNYDLDGIKAIILRPYHSGTVNIKSHEFLTFVSKAKQRNIPVYLVNLQKGINYESVKRYANSGIDVLPFCSFPSIYMKAWIGNSMECDFDEFMKTSIAGEF
ncbi:MAG: asparaginase [Clostridia bacterium]|nr:asparaginase [Clostridia bacterium]